MDTDTVWRHIDTERESLAGVLDHLTPEQWAHPSLCTAWTVRDVAAHLAWNDVRAHQVILPLLRAGLRHNVFIRDVAIRSPLSTTQIVAQIRSFSGRRVKPPFVSDLEPLIDVMVHTQDICLPLGLEHEPPIEALAVAIPRTIELNEGPFALRSPLRAVRLVATDADWQLGHGRVLEGPMRYLLLAVAGRDVRAHLAGDLAALA